MPSLDALLNAADSALRTLSGASHASRPYPAPAEPADALATPELSAGLAWALDARLLEHTATDRLVLSTRGRLLANEVFVRLI